MRKWLMAIFLLMITTIGIVGYLTILHPDGTEVQIEEPNNPAILSK